MAVGPPGTCACDPFPILAAVFSSVLVLVSSTAPLWWRPAAEGSTVEDICSEFEDCRERAQPVQP